MSDAPEHDLQEQHQEVDPAERRDPPDRDPEAPEADAIEQATEVPETEEER